MRGSRTDPVDISSDGSIYSKQKNNNKLRLTYVAKVNKKGEEHTMILKVPILGCI